MNRSRGQLLLSLIGGLFATTGFLAWIGLAWKAITDLDDVTPQSEEGGQLMSWALAGTVLMIVGTVILHIAWNAAEREEK